MAASTAGRIRWLSEWFEETRHVDPLLIEEIFLESLPTRLFRSGVEVEADILLEPVVRALSHGLLAGHPELPGLVKTIENTFRLHVTAKDGALTLNKLRALRKEWQILRPKLQQGGVDGAAEFVAWFDRDVEEVLALAQHSGRTPAAAAAVSTAARTRPAREVVTRAEAMRVYEAFVSATADASPELFVSMQQLGVLLRRKDPVWWRVAAALQNRDLRHADALATALQGILGEALALRHPWVSHLLGEAHNRAKRIAKALGPDWQVIFVEADVLAGKTAGAGLGQLYDTSIWVARRTSSGGELVAAPVWVLEVKAGTVAEAAEQIGRDWVRELRKVLELPGKGGKTESYRISNLRELLSIEGVDLTAQGLGDATTGRVLVAPRPPTDRSLKGNLPKGVAVDFVPAMMSKPDLRNASLALAKYLKRTAGRP